MAANGLVSGVCRTVTSDAHESAAACSVAGIGIWLARPCRCSEREFEGGVTSGFSRNTMRTAATGEVPEGNDIWR